MSVAFKLTVSDLQSAVHKALKAWGNLDGTPEDLLADLLLVQEQRTTSLDDNPTTLRLATNQVLLMGMEELEKQDKRGARILKMRFVENDTTLMVANKLYLSADQIKRSQKKAIESLTHILLTQEETLRQTRIQKLHNALEPPAYTTLYGVDDARQMLVNKLLQKDMPWVVTIIGIGGIGKTSLADAVARDIITHFYYERVIWLRVNTPIHQKRTTSPEPILDNLMIQLGQQVCPQMPPETPPRQRTLQIRQMLKAIPYLIVIDNLEAEADIAYLLDYLHDLANPSKFLLTSRTRPFSRVGIFSFPLYELSKSDAAMLVRHYAKAKGFLELANIADEEIGRIYDTVGGNPLALKLVVSLAETLSLPHILNELIQAQTQEIEDMYKHIYWQAWHSLRPESQHLLEIMPLAAGMGLAPEQMLIFSGDLTQNQLWPAINELVSRSLLEVRGTPLDRRYSIHQLTETFLRTEIIHWPESES